MTVTEQMGDRLTIPPPFVPPPIIASARLFPWPVEAPDRSLAKMTLVETPSEH